MTLVLKHKPAPSGKVTAMFTITHKTLKLSAAVLMAGAAFGSTTAVAAADTPSSIPAIVSANSIYGQSLTNQQTGLPSGLTVSSLAPVATATPTATTWSQVTNSPFQSTSATAPSNGGWN